MHKSCFYTLSCFRFRLATFAPTRNELLEEVEELEEPDELDELVDELMVEPEGGVRSGDPLAEEEPELRGSTPIYQKGKYVCHILVDIRIV